MKRYLAPILIAASMLASSVLVACGQKASTTEIYVYHNDQYRYMIEYPSSWSLDVSGEKVHISRPLHEYITVGVLEGEQLTLEGLEWLFESAVKEIAASVEDFHMASKGRLLDVGHPAWQLVWSGKTNKGLAFKAKSRYIAYEDKVYVITAGAPGIELPSELETVLRSFCFLEEYVYDTKLDEVQAIELTRDYLRSKAEQVPGFAAGVRKYIIEAELRGDLLSAEIEVLNEMKPNDWVNRDRTGIQLFDSKGKSYIEVSSVSALKKIAKYDGRRWWLVSIGGNEWYFDERTRRAIAANEAAASLLEEITLKTYYNSKYGYYVDYPPSWVIRDEDKSEVFITSDDGLGTFTVIASDEKQLARYGGLQGYIANRLATWKSRFPEFEIVQASSVGRDYSYTYRQGNTKYEGRWHFLQYGTRVFEIACLAELQVPSTIPFFTLYDPSGSFRFQP